MALITWRKEFEIGIESVDHEHRELIDLINQLHEGFDQGATRETVAGFLGEVHARISAHFALEERVMRELEYDEYADHKEDHETLLDDLRDIMDAFEEGSYADFEAGLGEQLQAWFGEHFRTKDARLHTFLHDRGM